MVKNSSPEDSDEDIAPDVTSGPVEIVTYGPEDTEIVDRLDTEDAPIGNEDVGVGEGDEAEPNDGDLYVDDAQGLLRGHTASVYTVSASPTDPNILASGGGDDVAIIWDLSSGTAQTVVEGFEDSVCASAFSHDGTYAAFGSMNGAVVVYHVPTLSPKCTLDGPGDAIEFLAWHPRGAVLLAGSADGTSWMWNVERGADSAFMAVLSGHGGPVTCGGFTPDGRMIVTASGDGTVRLWNPRDGSCVGSVEQKDAAAMAGVAAGESVDGSEVVGVVSLAFRRGGDGSAPVVATGGIDGSLCLSVVHVEGGAAPPAPSAGIRMVGAPARHGDAVESVDFGGPDGTLLASAGADGVVQVWDTEVGRIRCRFEHDAGVVSCRFHRGHRDDAATWMLVSCSVDRTVRVWDTRVGANATVWRGHTDAILAMVPLADSGVASASDDHTLRVFRT